MTYETGHDGARQPINTRLPNERGASEPLQKFNDEYQEVREGSMSNEGLRVTLGLMSAMSADRAVYRRFNRDTGELEPVMSMGQKLPLECLQPLSIEGKGDHPQHPAQILWNSGNELSMIDDMWHASDLSDDVRVHARQDGTAPDILENRGMACFIVRKANGDKDGVLQLSTVPPVPKGLADLSRVKINVEELHKAGKSKEVDQYVELMKNAPTAMPKTNTALAKILLKANGKYIANPGLRERMLTEKEQVVFLKQIRVPFYDRTESLFEEFPRLRDFLEPKVSEAEARLEPGDHKAKQDFDKQFGAEKKFLNIYKDDLEYSPPTRFHCQRVGNLTDNFLAFLYQLMNDGEELKGDRRELYHMAAEMHDVGKIATGLSLVYPGRLGPLEGLYMRQHVVDSRNIVNMPGMDPDIVDMVGDHHLGVSGKPDGRTYAANGVILPYRSAPRDLHRPSIEAQALMISDSFDAMVWDRVYQKGRRRGVALGELRGDVAKGYIHHDLLDVFIEGGVYKTHPSYNRAYKPKEPEPIAPDKLANMTPAEQTDALQKQEDFRRKEEAIVAEEAKEKLTPALTVTPETEAAFKRLVASTKDESKNQFKLLNQIDLAEPSTYADEVKAVQGRHAGKPAPVATPY